MYFCSIVDEGQRENFLKNLHFAAVLHLRAQLEVIIMEFLLKKLMVVRRGSQPPTTGA